MGRKLQQSTQTGFFHQAVFQQDQQSASGLLRLDLRAKAELNGGILYLGLQHLPLSRWWRAGFPVGP